MRGGTLQLAERATGAATTPAAELAGLTWTRTQLAVRLRPGSGTLPDPDRLVLVGPGDAGMPPTGRSTDAGATVVRFNVMSGPRQQPLASGHWTLSVAGDGGATAPLRLSAPAGAAGVEAPVTFAIRGGRQYAVRAALDGPGASLVLDVQAPRSRSWRARRRYALKLLGRTVLSVAQRVFRAIPGRRRRRVLFMSSRVGLTGNNKVVHDRMLERGLDRRVEMRTLAESDRKVRGRLSKVVTLLRQLWVIARADVILVENSRHQLLYQLRFPPDVRFIQLWHAAGAFKTVKNSRIGKRGGPDPWGVRHKNYTHVTVSSELEVPFYAEAFGIPESRVVATGIPRQDVFFDERRRAAGLASARAAYPEAEGRFTILFAPTYRGSALKARYDLDRLDYRALHALCIEKDAVCIIRMHPAVRHPIGIPDELRDRLLEKPAVHVDVRDLMFAVDLLVTDYSSIMFDFALLRRPMLFYAYDLEEYVGARDFYEPYEAFVPGRIVRSFDELLDAIRRDDYERAKVDEFVARRYAHTDGRATDRVIDELVLAGG
jgi:CDP-glycerol glycerophosphotransferase (TagB/SpsB family)